MTDPSLTRDFPERRGSIEMLCIYEVAVDLIVKASVAFGVPVIAPASA